MQGVNLVEHLSPKTCSYPTYALCPPNCWQSNYTIAGKFVCSIIFEFLFLLLVGRGEKAEADMFASSMKLSAWSWVPEVVCLKLCAWSCVPGQPRELHFHSRELQLHSQKKIPVSFQTERNTWSYQQFSSFFFCCGTKRNSIHVPKSKTTVTSRSYTPLYLKGKENHFPLEIGVFSRKSLEIASWNRELLKSGHTEKFIVNSFQAQTNALILTIPFRLWGKCNSGFFPN